MKGFFNQATLLAKTKQEDQKKTLKEIAAKEAALKEIANKEARKLQFERLKTEFN